MSNSRIRWTAPALCTVLVATAVVLAVTGSAATGTAAAGTAAATHPSTSPSFVVELAEDGSAEVTLTLTYDLETDDERTAFRTLQNDSETRTDTRERFGSRMAAVADDASNATGRDMGVSDASTDLSVSDDGHVGVVELGVTWSNLAATGNGRLVVSEPFASGYEPDRAFTVRGPDGYERASASPSPDGMGPNAATWDAESDLSGFEVTFEASSTGAGGPGDADGGADGSAGAPGFGTAVALLALAAAALALARRR